MKLDYDLIRNLLLEIENVTDGDIYYTPKFFYEKFPNIDQKVVWYHLKYLSDINFVQCNRNYDIYDISPSGRDYLNSIRDEKIWNKTRTISHSLGQVALSIVSDVATSLIKRSLGL